MRKLLKPPLHPQKMLNQARMRKVQMKRVLPRLLMLPPLKAIHRILQTVIRMLRKKLNQPLLPRLPSQLLKRPKKTLMTRLQALVTLRLEVTVIARMMKLKPRTRSLLPITSEPPRSPSQLSRRNRKLRHLLPLLREHRALFVSDSWLGE